MLKLKNFISNAVKMDWLALPLTITLVCGLVWMVMSLLSPPIITTLLLFSQLYMPLLMVGALTIGSFYALIFYLILKSSPFSHIYRSVGLITFTLSMIAVVSTVLFSSPAVIAIFTVPIILALITPVIYLSLKRLFKSKKNPPSLESDAIESLLLALKILVSTTLWTLTANAIIPLWFGFPLGLASIQTIALGQIIVAAILVGFIDAVGTTLATLLINYFWEQRDMEHGKERFMKSLKGIFSFFLICWLCGGLWVSPFYTCFPTMTPAIRVTITSAMEFAGFSMLPPSLNRIFHRSPDKMQRDSGENTSKKGH